VSAAIDYGRRATRSRSVSLACFALLLLTITVDVFGREEIEPRMRTLLWLIQSLPLLLFLPGLLRGRWKTYLWLCFALLMYFLFAMNRLFSTQGGVLDACRLAAIVALFAAATLFARWRQRELAESDS
jgi:uncharacterized membrane protein